MKGRCLTLGAFAWLVFMTSALPQVTPEEHSKHHSAQDPPASPGGQSGPEQGGRMGPAMGETGGMGGMMDQMMERMGVPAPKELYPSLMSLPDLTPEKRAEVERLAHERMKAGAALMSGGLERMSSSAGEDDYPGLQEATAQMREGLAQFESGLAAHRALREGNAPRDVALQWFKREMNLLPAAGVEATEGWWGIPVRWFHYFIIAILGSFVAAMVMMYFHKMRRAEALLVRLASESPAVGGGTSATDVRVGEAPLGAKSNPSSTALSSPPGVPVAKPTSAPATAPPPQPGKWAGKLRVFRIFEETPDVKTFRMGDPAGGALPFAYLPGQYLTLSVVVDATPVKRSYTIASSPTKRDCLEITVKREELGVVSRYLHDSLKEGGELTVTAPSGYFTFTGKESDSIVLIAGGVGITPMMSVVRYLTDRGWPGDLYLLISCRTSRDFIFREELEHLQRRHPNLHVVATMTRAEGTVWMGVKGHLTKELIAQAVPEVGSRRVHLCGPPAMMDAVKQMLNDLGVSKQQLKTEAFGTAKRAPKLGAAAPAHPVAADEMQAGAVAVAAATVTFKRSSKSVPLPPDKTILEAAEEVGVEIDNSCRSGTCGSCKVKLLSGVVTMECEDALELEDKAQNVILACQAKSDGPVVVEA